MRNFHIPVASAAALVVLASASSALAAMKIGETQRFTMDDQARFGTANYLLRQKVGDRYMAVGGSIKRLAADRYLLCGYYIDLQRKESGKGPIPLGFVIFSDRTADHAKVIAPATQTQQEARGCWPGERARLNAAVEKLGKDQPTESSEVTTTSSDTRAQ